MGKRQAINEKCRILNCDNPVRSKGLCNAHYCRKRRTGNENSPRLRGLRGAGTKTSHGYRTIGQKYEHILIVEKILGKKLPKGAEVHHFNENKLDNYAANFVVCPNRAYHCLLHRRQRAMRECGNPNWIKCSYCKSWDRPDNLMPRNGPGSRAHYECAKAYNAQWRSSR